MKSLGTARLEALILSSCDPVDAFRLRAMRSDYRFKFSSRRSATRIGSSVAAMQTSAARPK